MPGKIKYHSLSESEKKKFLGDFYSIVSLLSNRDEVKIFFKDLLSLSEITMISRRLQVAKLLLNGASYREIRDDLGVGFATISKIDRWVNEGFGGYRKILKKYEKSNKKELSKIIEDRPDITLTKLKKRYPGHFLLLNLLDK